MREVVSVAAILTPTGSFQGSLASRSATALGSTVIRVLLAETDLAAKEIERGIMGQVLTAGCGQNPARQAALRAGIRDFSDESQMSSNRSVASTGP